MFGIFNRKAVQTPTPAPAPEEAPNEFDIWNAKVNKIQIGLNTLKNWATSPEEIEEYENILEEYSWVKQNITDQTSTPLRQELQAVPEGRNKQFWIRKIFKRFING
jgi:hypothetical protein